MHANFARALADVLMHEGGYVNHPNDPGGPTNKGITLATFRQHVKPNGTADDLKKITADQAGIVYREVYWKTIRGDELPGAIDYATFDYAVNSGPARAAKALQGILGVAQDGKIGPVTIKAARAADAFAVVNALCDQRLDFLKSLRTWGTFGRGWSSRVADVREQALQLTTLPSTPRPIEEHEEPIAPLPQRRRTNWLVIVGVLIALALAFVAFVPLPI